MAEPTVLHDLATSLLGIAVAAVTDAPERQYVSWAEPALDCELVTVHWQRTYGSGQPLPQPAVSSQQKRGVVWMAEFVVTVARCAPKMRGSAPPPAADLDAFAAVMLHDAHAVRHAIALAVKDGALQGECGVVAHRDAGPLAPSAFGAVTVGLAVKLN